MVRAELVRSECAACFSPSLHTTCRAHSSNIYRSFVHLCGDRCLERGIWCLRHRCVLRAFCTAVMLNTATFAVSFSFFLFSPPSHSLFICLPCTSAPLRRRPHRTLRTVGQKAFDFAAIAAKLPASARGQFGNLRGQYGVLKAKYVCRRTALHRLFRDAVCLRARALSQHHLCTTISMDTSLYSFELLLLHAFLSLTISILLFHP